MKLGPLVTNPQTRHLVVTASAIASVDELSGGRAVLGLGSGDSAIYTIGAPPATVAGLEDSIATLGRLTAGEVVDRGGRPWRVHRATRRVPIYLAAEGPRTLELAGRVADGVICGLGLTPEVIALSLAAIERGARAAGRTLDDVDVWWFAKTSLADSRAAAIEPIKMALAASANHAFRFTLDGKGVPPRPAREDPRAPARVQRAPPRDRGGRQREPARPVGPHRVPGRPLRGRGPARRLRGPAPARDDCGGAPVHDHRIRAGSARVRAPMDEGGRRRSLILAAFRVRSFRFQWPADLLTSWAFEMETLILGWYVMVQTGSVLLLTIFGSAQFLGTLAAPMFGVLGDRVGGRLMLCAMRAIYAALARAVMILAFTGGLTPAWAIALAALNGIVRPNDLVMRNA